MSGLSRSILKLSFTNRHRLAQFNDPPTTAPSAAPAPAPVPAPAPAPAPKLKLKFNKPKPDGAPAKPKKPKKIGPNGVGNGEPSKKRAHDVEPAPEEPKPTLKRIKFNTKPPPPASIPNIRLKSKGEPPRRPVGAGYDSEASDTEIDPALEEEFILRMQPGEDYEYLKKAIEEKRFGPKSHGGADVAFKALTRDGRRATVTVQGHIYAATLVDLPCILEAMKSWDKRGWYKSADVCQMLLVLGRVNSEEEARTYPLPKDVEETTFQFAHGITPPLRWARKRRFRKRISNRTIEAVELEVARLLREDQEAIAPPEFEIMDYSQFMREEEEAAEATAAQYQAEQEQYADGDADGDLFGHGDDALAADLEAALAAHAEEGAEGGMAEQPATGVDDSFMTATSEPASHHQPVPPAGPDHEPFADETGTATNTAISGVNIEESSDVDVEGEPEEDEDESSDDGGDGDADDLDDDAREQARQRQEQREEMAELEARIAGETAKWERLTNPILKGKLGKSIVTLRQELELKKVSVGQE